MSTSKPSNNKQIKTNTIRQDLEKHLNKYLKTSADPEKLFEKMDNLFNKYEAADKKEKEKIADEISAVGFKVMVATGIDTHVPLAESVHPDHHVMAIEVANKLIDEYQCKSASERALAQLAANSYSRFMTFSKRLTQATELEYLSSQKNGYYSMISKEVDRSQRRFISAIMSLKQIKSPTMNLHFKADTAFVAQNQQINTDNKTPDEKIIEAQ